MTREKTVDSPKKARRKLVRRIFAWFFVALFAVILIIFVVSAIRWSIHKKSPKVYGDYVFDSTAPFGEEQLDLFPSLVIDENAESLKILQLADPQIKFGNFPNRDRKTLSLIEKAIKEEKPDLCVVTGDLTLSIFTYDAYKYFADFMQKMDVKWTLVYGNHDAQFDCSKYTLYKLLSKYDNFLFSPGPSNVYGESNFLINVYKGEKKAEKLCYSLVMLDSGMYPQAENVKLADWVYDWIHQSQMDWYEWAINGLKTINPNIQSSMFFHIPLKEFASMYYANELANGREIPSAIDATTLKTVSGVTGVICESNKKSDELVWGDDGYNVGIFYQGNAEGVTDHPDVFQYIQNLDCTKAVFCGHDHVNNMKGYYDGIYLAYGRCCGYHTYPFFKKNNFKKVLWNGSLWVDENGNQMEKGVTVINVSLVDGSGYGAINAYDKQAGEYNI